MLQPSPAIQGPSPEVLHKLLETIEAGRLVSGPAFCWDPVRAVFMMVIVQSGVIIHWQLEPARDQAEADQLRSVYMHRSLVAARLLLETLPPESRAQLDADLAVFQGLNKTHH